MLTQMLAQVLAQMLAQVLGQAEMTTSGIGEDRVGRRECMYI